MNIELEELRNELKKMIDLTIDKYIEQENAVIEIPIENIFMEFSVGNERYVAFSDESEYVEELNMKFAKVDLVDGIKILRNVTTNEYSKVLNEFYRRLNLM